MEGVSAIAAFASAFAGIRPALSNLYVVNTLVTGLIVNSISSLEKLDSSYCTYNPSLGKGASSWMENADVLANYTGDVQAKAMEFIRLSHDEFPESATAHLKSSLAGMEKVAQTIANALQEDGPLVSFLNSCQVDNDIQCQMSSCYAVNLMKTEIMAYILAMWAKNSNSDAQTYKLIDSMYSNVTQHISRETIPGTITWYSGPLPLASAVISFNDYLHAVVFYGDNTIQKLLTARARVGFNRVENPTTEDVSFSPIVKPSLVSLNGEFHLLYLGRDNQLYYRTKGPDDEYWSYNSGWNPAELFPGFSATNGFSTSILRLVTAGSNLYLIGVSPSSGEMKGVLVYQIQGSAQPSENYLVGKGLGDPSWAHPQYYTSFQAVDVGGVLYVFGRGAYGILICRLNVNPFNNNFMIINTVQEFKNEFFPQQWNNPSHYETIRVMYANGNLIFCGRWSAGITTVVYQQFLANPYAAPLVIAPTGTFSEDVAYKTIRGYVAGSKVFLDAFVGEEWCGGSCSWTSCELVNFAWQCDAKGVTNADVNNVGMTLLPDGNSFRRHLYFTQGNAVISYPNFDTIFI